MRALLLSTFLGACGAGDPAETAVPPPADPCAGSLSAGTVEVFASGFASTEGVAFSPDGRLFVSAGDIVAEIFPDGRWEEVVALEGGVGLAWFDGTLVAAGRPEGIGSVVAIDVDARTTRLLSDQIPSSNFLTPSPWGTLLVSDADAAIWEVDPVAGTTTSWLELPGPNGMVFTPDQSTLWVVNTWDNPAPAWQVPVQDGVAGTPVEVHTWTGGNFPDGVALGQSGDLYTSLNLTGRISRLSPDGTETVVAEGVSYTASLAFGIDDRWDRCAIYSTSLFSDEVFKVGIGEPGYAP